MSAPKNSKGKISIGADGIGNVTEDEIQKRAGELASINGRGTEGITDEDIAQAREEMEGDGLPASSIDDEQAKGSLTRDPSDPPSYTGRQIPDREGPDEEQVVERLVIEGVEEANHEQMLQGRRKRE